jgi:hypothetical protein
MCASAARLRRKERKGTERRKERIHAWHRCNKGTERKVHIV